MARYKIINDDIVTALPKCNEIDLIVADPPYNLSIAYDGQSAKDDKLPVAKYRSWCDKWIQLCASALGPSGSMWLIASDENIEYQAVAMNDAGLTRRAWVTWYESFGTNREANWNKTTRHLLYYVKNKDSYTFNVMHPAARRPSDRLIKYNDKRANPDGKLWDDLWGIPLFSKKGTLIRDDKDGTILGAIPAVDEGVFDETWGIPLFGLDGKVLKNGDSVTDSIPRVCGTFAERIPDVPTQLPIKLLRRIVATTCKEGGRVLDPFVGSGTTGVAAVEHGCDFIGIDQSKKYCDIARNRIRRSKPKRLREAS